MKLTRRSAAAAVLAGVMLLSSGCGTAASSTSEKEKEFQPRLDTDAKVQLTTLGFFGNFEALDQVTNDFNQYYPNVTFNYQQVGGSSLEEYLDSNPGVDLFMTSAELLHGTETTLPQRCIDLSKEDFAFDAIDSSMLQNCQVNGQQLSIPMAQNIYGIVANTSLLEKEGLSLPENQEEFLQTLAALKEKGYTPVQGPTNKIYAELTANMVFSGLCDGQPLQKALKDNDMETAADLLRPATDLIDTLLSNGYTAPAINDAYPEDNYDEAILRFFEGEVPFWVCNTEKVSGMKKRESKSEAFQQNPFSYTFFYLPLNENTPHLYREPWFGFAANKDGSNTDYAVEFLRFLATKDEINKMAEVKGVPSVAKDPENLEIYSKLLESDTIKNSCVNTGSVTPAMMDGWYTCITDFARNDSSSPEDTIQNFLELCKENLS